MLSPLLFNIHSGKCVDGYGSVNHSEWRTDVTHEESKDEDDTVLITESAERLQVGH